MDFRFLVAGAFGLFIWAPSVRAQDAFTPTAPTLTEKPYRAEGKLGLGRPGQTEDQMLHGPMESVVRFFSQGEKTRIEAYEDVASISAEKALGATPTCEISDEDDGAKYVFTPGDKKASKLPLSPEKTDPIAMLAHFARGSIQYVGVENVGAVACNKFRKIFPNGKPAFIWVDATTGAPLKIADGQSFVLVFHSFQYGPQDGKLFVPPGD